MSEFTSSIIVKDKTNKEIADLLMNKDTYGFAFPVNENWSATVLNNKIEEWSDISCDISNNLNTFVFVFFNYEDCGWKI